MLLLYEMLRSHYCQKEKKMIVPKIFPVGNEQLYGGSRQIQFDRTLFQIRSVELLKYSFHTCVSYVFEFSLHILCHRDIVISLSRLACGYF